MFGYMHKQYTLQITEITTYKELYKVNSTK